MQIKNILNYFNSCLTEIYFLKNVIWKYKETKLTFVLIYFDYFYEFYLFYKWDKNIFQKKHIIWNESKPLF